MSRRALIVVLVALASCCGLAASAASADHAFATAMYPSTVADLRKVPSSGARMVRLALSWSAVAPVDKPQKWNPADPADPNYRWNDFDTLVKKATALGLTIYVTVAGAPSWAQAQPAVTDPLDARMPDPVAYGQFARAVAERYSGSFEGLSRIKYFQAWNEPNISISLVPQFADGKPVSPTEYRNLLNSFARAVHSVHRDNVVVAAGLAPFRDLGSTQQDRDWGPLSFLRALLCVSASGRPTCKTRVDADVWAMHPYTSGGPTHHAVLPNDVSLGDLPKFSAVLAAAGRAGHLSKRNPPLWVTEFSWDSNPPDPKGVPTTLLTRWVAQAMYQMWADGVSLVTWLQVQDQPLSQSFFQSGLWYMNGKAKPTLQAFRFPFVALPEGDRVLVWGRTPGGVSESVVIEQSRGYGWRPVATLSPDSSGVFHDMLSITQTGRMRARLVGTDRTSPPFGLAPVPDQFFNPFGEPTLLEPKRSAMKSSK
jgi:hypothetical protein